MVKKHNSTQKITNGFQWLTYHDTCATYTEIENSLTEFHFIAKKWCKAGYWHLTEDLSVQDIHNEGDREGQVKC